MTSAVSKTYQPIIGQTFNHVRAKLTELQNDIKREEERTKEVKMAVREEHVRERAAVDQQRGMRDRMQVVDGLIDKIQAKIQYTKEREFVAARRYQENVKMCETLKRNKIDVPFLEEKIEDSRDKAAEIIQDIAELTKKVEAKTTKVLDTERRELRARNKIDHYEEMLRTTKQIETHVARNYEPMTEDKFHEAISELRDRLDHAVRQIRAKEARQAVLEKREVELQAHIDKMKRKALDAQQTNHELEGSRL